MAFRNISQTLIPFAVLLFALITLSGAQNSAQDFLNCHNNARTQLNVGMSSVTWSTTLANYAQNYANQRKSDCALTHSPNSPYGENLAKGSSGSFSGVDAVNLWVAEKQYYTYSNNSCALNKECGHYTQVVWAQTTQIGCGTAQCTNGWHYVVCSYNPPGNWVGEWPY